MITIYGIGVELSYEESGALELLRSQGVAVKSILPPNSTEADLHVARANLSKFYTDVQIYSPGDFSRAGVVLSFGRPEIFAIVKNNNDKPGKLVYGLQNVSATNVEIKAASEGQIDEIFTQSSKRAIETVSDLVKKSQRGVEHRLGYVPFCNPSSEYNNLRFIEAKSSSLFLTIRDTPDNGAYSFPDHWRMVSSLTAPFEKEKKYTALNWGRALSKKAGDPGNLRDRWNGVVDAELFYKPATLQEISELYSQASALLHFYPADDVFCFSAAKAILSGVVVIGSPLPAFIDLITHGETGFIARTADEAVYFTSRLAWEPHLRAKLAANAYNWLITKGPGNPDNCLPWWQALLK